MRLKYIQNNIADRDNDCVHKDRILCYIRYHSSKYYTMYNGILPFSYIGEPRIKSRNRGSALRIITSIVLL